MACNEEAHQAGLRGWDRIPDVGWFPAPWRVGGK